MGIFDRRNGILCTISIIGRTAFNVATNYWIVFITRLVYKMVESPGKCYKKFVQYILKNTLLTYIPSALLSIFLMILLLIHNSPSDSECW
jgi:hypothetical protein